MDTLSVPGVTLVECLRCLIKEMLSQLDLEHNSKYQYNNHQGQVYK